MAECQVDRETQKKRTWTEIVCPHCSDIVTKTTFYRHKRQFYDAKTRRWIRDVVGAKIVPDSVGTSTPSMDLDESSTGSCNFESENGVAEDIFVPPSPPSASPSSGGTSTIDTTELEDEDKVFFPDSDEDERSGGDDYQNESEVWECLNGDSSDSDSPVQGTEEDPTPKPITYLLVFILLWQAAYKISNSAIACLLRFMRYLIRLIGHAFQCDAAVNASNFIPITASSVHRLILNRFGGSFVEYVVCPSCDSLYEFNECFRQIGNNKVSKTCCHIPFPNHPHANKRVPCGATLLKKQKIKHGYKLVPIKSFPYRPLKKSILHMINRPNFLEKCEQWRERCKKLPEGFLGDIYDGRIWQKFSSSETNYFLRSPYSYLLTLNIDWFQPFTRSVYSTGAIYLTIQNLPRTERYKPDNVILVGLIPGPREPKLTTNSYLTPLVEELKEFWTGVILPITVAGKTLNICVRLALTCVACDIPASRKVCGFLGHAACLGCNKCLRKFKLFVNHKGKNKVDFSGFDRENWPMRTAEQHREECKKLLLEKTPTSLANAESHCGLRFSILLVLPYFDPIKFTVIDPMHNLYLGTGKKVFKVWVKQKLLSDESLLLIENRAKHFIVPYDIGRLPSNISTGYGGFTANQWYNWITIYSPILLKDLLPPEHLRCWLLFVRACSITKSRIISVNEAKTADLFLLQFCKDFQSLYGAENCTPNIHLHNHLMECILDYGPLHTFWCYAFERYNGILGSMQTNGKSIESQLMRRFCREQELSGLQLPDDADFCSILPRGLLDTQDISLAPHCNTDEEVGILLKMTKLPIRSVPSFAMTAIIKPLPPAKEKVLSADLVHHLRCVYQQLYPSRRIQQIPYFYEEYGRVLLAGDVIGSIRPGTNAKCSSVIMAYWPGRGNNLQEIDTTVPRVGVVQYFIKHSVVFYKDNSSGVCHTQTDTVQHVFCYLSWKQVHPYRDWYGVSAQVTSSLNEIPDMCSLMPVQRIAYRCAHANLRVTFPNNYEETVFIACPIPIKYSI